jgi:formiminoglutamase
MSVNERPPHTRPFDWAPLAPAESRFAHRLATAEPTSGAVALLGLPDDTGVTLNGGRAGAAAGPAAFRGALSRLGAADPVGLEWPAVWDAGDVVPGESREETHERVSQAADWLFEAGMLPVAVGGGHDLTYPFVRPLTASGARYLAGVYFDAHLDVRLEAGSGMAFRRLVEVGGIRELHVHGFRPLLNRADHLTWFQRNGGQVFPDRSELGWPEMAQRLFVSFDLDVLDMAYAPGVSAPNPSGWTPREAEAWVRACGAEPRVRCFDLMELCPMHDEGGRTARLAAHLFLMFLTGVATRR